MTETTQDLLARLTGFCKNVAKMKCPCGHKSCSQYTLTTQGSVGFDLEDADLYAAAPRLHRELASALAREAALREALLDAAKLAKAHGSNVFAHPSMVAWCHQVVAKICAALAVKP